MASTERRLRALDTDVEAWAREAELTAAEALESEASSAAELQTELAGVRRQAMRRIGQLEQALEAAEAELRRRGEAERALAGRLGDSSR